MNQKIATGVGTLIIIIIAVTMGAFVWLYEKDRPIDSGQVVQNLPVNKKSKTAPAAICKNLCGDGNCDEFVCMSTSCPCPETKESCPQDCFTGDISITDWQTYKNEKYGFEFQYPKDWKLKTSNELGEDANEIVPSKQQNCSENPWQDGKKLCLDQIYFGIVENKNGLTIDNFWKEINGGWTNEDAPTGIKNLKSFLIGNNKAYKFTTVSAFDGTEDNNFWVTLSDNNFFAIGGSYLEGNENIILDKILSTFKFTK